MTEFFHTNDTLDLTAWSQQRDAAAFEQIVSRHYAWVLAAARKKLGFHSAWAEDATQEVFCSLAKNASRVSDGCLGGWLHRQMMYCCLKRLRTESRLLDRNAKASSPEQTSQDTLLAVSVDDALAQLSSKDREALVLRFYRSMTMPELGNALGITVTAAQKRVERATARLRGYLQHKGVKTSAELLGTFLLALCPDSAQATQASEVGRKAANSAPEGNILGVTLNWWLAARVAACVTMVTAFTIPKREVVEHLVVDGPMLQIEPVKIPLDPLAETLAMLERTGRDGLSVLRRFRLNLALEQTSEELLPRLALYAMRHTSDKEVQSALLEKWAMIDFMAAWPHCQTLNRLGGRGVIAAVSAFAKKSPIQAKEWFLSQSPETQNTLGEPFFEGIGAVQSENAGRLLDSLKDGVSPMTYSDWQHAYIRGFASQNAPEAAKLAVQEKIRLTEILPFWAKVDLPAAIAFAKQHDSNDFARVGMQDEIAANHPESIETWFRAPDWIRPPQPGTREAGWDSLWMQRTIPLVKKWASTDMPGLQRFTEEAEQPTLRRALLVGMVARLRETDSAAAQTLISTIQEDDLRSQLENVLSNQK